MVIKVYIKRKAITIINLKEIFFIHPNPGRNSLFSYLLSFYI